LHVGAAECTAWKKTPKSHWLNRRCCGSIKGTKWRERRRKFKPFLPLIIIGRVRSQTDRMDKLGPLMRTQQEYQKGNITFFHCDMAGGTTLTSLYSAFRLYGTNSKGEGFQSLLTTDGVILDISQRRSISLSQMLNYWL